jgi:hypothetical protein
MNYAEKRRDRRLGKHQSGKRKVVVIPRERGGNSLPAMFQSESHASASSAPASPRVQCSTPTRLVGGAVYDSLAQMLYGGASICDGRLPMATEIVWHPFHIGNRILKLTDSFADARMLSKFADCRGHMGMILSKLAGGITALFPINRARDGKYNNQNR